MAARMRYIVRDQLPLFHQELMKLMKESILAAPIEPAVDNKKQSLQDAVEKRFSKGKIWCYIGDSLGWVLSGSLRSLIVSYLDPEMNYDFMQPINYTHRGVSSRQCHICDSMHYNRWVVMSGYSRDSQSAYIYQIICITCLAVDNEKYKHTSHVRCSDGSEPVWLNEYGKPKIDWNDKPAFAWKETSPGMSLLIPVNNIAMMQYHNITERCLILPMSEFNVSDLSLEYPGLDKLFECAFEYH